MPVGSTELVVNVISILKKEKYFRNLRSNNRDGSSTEKNLGEYFSSDLLSLVRFREINLDR